MIQWISFIIGAIFILFALGIFAVEIIGSFKFKYVLNRMHAAAIGDTLGIGLMLLGLIIICGVNLTSLKLFLIIAFLWCSSPVASHLIARLEVTTNEDGIKHYSFKSLDEKEEKDGTV